MTLDEALAIAGLKLVGNTFFMKEAYEAQHSFPIAPRIISIRMMKAKQEHEKVQTEHSHNVLAAWEHVIMESNNRSFAEMDAQSELDRC